MSRKQTHLSEEQLRIYQQFIDFVYAQEYEVVEEIAARLEEEFEYVGMF